jgi:hypothetical protein
MLKKRKESKPSKQQTTRIVDQNPWNYESEKEAGHGLPRAS